MFVLLSLWRPGGGLWGRYWVDLEVLNRVRKSTKENLKKTKKTNLNGSSTAKSTKTPVQILIKIYIYIYTCIYIYTSVDPCIKCTELGILPRGLPSSQNTSLRHAPDAPQEYLGILPHKETNNKQTINETNKQFKNI